MNFLTVRGQGDPNEEGGAYKQALELLYAVAFTIKMSKMGDHKLEGYFDYVVPPLEGIWWQEGIHGVDYSRKKDFQWISLIRLPEFVTEEVFDWAIREAAEKKQRDFSKVEFFSWEEGLCVQCMHIGPYDDEPATVAAIGTLTIPAMTERGYDKMFAAAVVASAGAIGVMIPPSNPFVVYGVAGQASVGKLFLAGITPGILTGLVLMLVAYCIAKRTAGGRTASA